MEKIILTDEQKQVIQEQLDGKIEVHSATEKQQELLMQVIDMAEARLDEYPEGYDFGRLLGSGMSTRHKRVRNNQGKGWGESLTQTRKRTSERWHKRT